MHHIRYMYVYYNGANVSWDLYPRVSQGIIRYQTSAQVYYIYLLPLV